MSFVVHSRHLVLARLRKPNEVSKIPGNQHAMCVDLGRTPPRFFAGVAQVGVGCSRELERCA